MKAPKLHSLLTGLATCLAVGGLALFTSCDSGGDHDHDHGDHDHGDHEHDHDHDHGDDHAHADGEEHDHAHHTKTPGPNGGRILTEVEPHLEFKLNDDHTVQIIAVTEDGKPAALGSQVISVTGGDRANPAELTFTRQGDALVSTTPFPKGERLPVIVEVSDSETPDGESVFARFTLDLSDCPSCDYLEYACICDHDHEH